mgnify:CR=1 FL=1
MPTFTVDTTSDTVDAHDGMLSLREALARADRTEEADTIRFAEAVQGGTIVLAGSELTVASAVTIDGGSGVTIDADDRSRVLLMQDPGAGEHFVVTLSHLTITGGRTRREGEGGAGISDASGYAHLELDHVSVTGNHAAADGAAIGGFFYDIFMSNSTVARNSAAGIDGFYVTVVRSTIADNGGSGVSALRGLYMHETTVSGNIGDGISGEGVFVDDSTISNNSGYGVGWSSYASMSNITVSGNRGGGINANDGRGYLYNSIVAGNGATGDADADVYGYVFSNGANIFGSEVAGATPSDRQNIAPDQIFAAVDPRTGGGLLADNGGPTLTIALRDARDNPALGRADPAAASDTDQRGEARPQPGDTRPDIGAFELDESDPQPQPVAATFVVTSTSDTIADDGVLTLREALALADADSVTVDRIRFAPDLQNETIVLSGGQLEVHSDVTIDGAGVTIDAHGASRVLLVQGFETQLTLRHLTITGGRASGDAESGGGILADNRTTSLTLDHVSVVNNTSANGSGGGISGYEMTLINSTVTGNTAAANGGGIAGASWGSGYYVTLINSAVSGNRAMGGGGGIYGDQFGTSVSLTNSTVSDNVANHHGGGICGDWISLTNSTVSGNRTMGDNYAGGGGIYGTHVTLANSTVSGNHTAGIDAAGGGIGLRSDDFRTGTISISNSIVAGNTTAASPGPDLGSSVDASNGHNIFGSDVDGAAVGDVENVWASLLFAAVDPTTGGGLLADNGGPTQTIALRDTPDNPALGGADPTSAPATDQRGVTRPLPGGTNPDIGAFEHAALPMDGLQYIASYADLIRVLGPDEAAGEAHYRAYGAAEGRQVPFDGLEYIASYADLIAQLGADRDGGSSHFIRYGLDEGRSTSFDGLEYIASHPDLIAALGADRATGSRHFIEQGAVEGRQTTFDGLQYIASHEDLITALGPSADAGAVHYIRSGHGEERVQDDFDAEQYLANYADLQAAFGSDTEAATIHYIRYGHAEGRRDEPFSDFLL